MEGQRISQLENMDSIERVLEATAATTNCRKTSLP